MSKAKIVQPKEEKPKIAQDIKTSNVEDDGYPDAIMEDTVYTMEDSRVLMGNPTAPDSPKIAQRDS